MMGWNRERNKVKEMGMDHLMKLIKNGRSTLMPIETFLDPRWKRMWTNSTEEFAQS